MAYVTVMFPYFQILLQNGPPADRELSFFGQSIHNKLIQQVGSCFQQPEPWPIRQQDTSSFTREAAQWWVSFVKTLSTETNDRHLTDIFKHILCNENIWTSVKISLKFFPYCPIKDNPVLVQIMAWRRTVDVLKDLEKKYNIAITVYQLIFNWHVISVSDMRGTDFVKQTSIHGNLSPTMSLLAISGSWNHWCLSSSWCV